MIDGLDAWGLLRPLAWEHVLMVIVVFLLAKVLSFAIRSGLNHVAGKAPPHLRLSILRFMPIARLLTGVGAAIVAIPILVEPTVRNVVALVAAVIAVLAFALKDYVSCVVAGLVTVLERSYQPGDWIGVGEVYGEVTSIASRAVRIVTPDDNEVSIPHSFLWSASISNATSGNRSLLCVAEFYLHPDHDAATARQRLAEVAENSAYLKPESKVSVIVLEKPWGTQYRVKAHVKESRDQFLLITDVTIRGKEALRAMGMRFAQAPYAETKRS